MSKEIEKQPDAEKGFVQRVMGRITALFKNKGLGIHQGGYGLSDEQNQKALAAIAKQATQEAEEEFAARAKAAEAETETSETETEAEAGGHMPPKKKMEGDDNEDDSEDTPDCKTVEPENQTNEKTPTQSEEIMNKNIEALLERIVATNQLLAKASEEQAKKIEAIEQAQKNAATQPEQPQRPAPNAAIHQPSVTASGENAQPFGQLQKSGGVPKTLQIGNITFDMEAMGDMIDEEPGLQAAVEQIQAQYLQPMKNEAQATIKKLGGQLF